MRAPFPTATWMPGTARQAIIPRAKPATARAKRAMKAMMRMQKIDIAGLERAAAAL